MKYHFYANQVATLATIVQVAILLQTETQSASPTKGQLVWKPKFSAGVARTTHPFILILFEFLITTGPTRDFPRAAVKQVS